jgi:acetyl esterase/lipase
MNSKVAFSLIVLWLAALACGGAGGAAGTALPPAVPTPGPSEVFQGGSPADHAGSVQRDVTYCMVEGVNLKMDIYVPKNRTQATPLVAYVHSGGWTQGDKTEAAGMVDAPALLDAGFTVASLDYRLAPQYKFPAMIEDVKCGVRSLRAHAAEYGIDPGKIGVWGISAGGHLVNLLGTTHTTAGFDVGQYLDQSSRVQAVVDMFGPADLTVEFSGGYHPVRDTVFGGFDPAKASPVSYISADDPPFLILQGAADQTVPLSQSQEFHDRLVAGGVSAQLVIVKNGPHGLDSPNEVPSRAELTQVIVQFFVEHLR